VPQLQYYNVMLGFSFQNGKLVHDNFYHKSKFGYSETELREMTEI